MRVLISLILVSFFLLAPELYAANSNRVVAHVNDDVITLYELNKKIEELTGKTCEEMQAADEQEFFDTRDEILDLLIDEKLADEKIKELELEATPQDIDNYIEMIKEENKWTQEVLVSYLKKEGLTYDKFREKLKVDIERDRLIDREIREKLIISEEDIAEYYLSNKTEYSKPGTAHIASIFLVPDSPGEQNQKDILMQKGKEILARLEKGEDFSALAGEFSNGPGAKEGGDLGNIRLADVDPKILEVIDSLKEGEVSPLIDFGSRIQIIKLIKKNEAEWVPLEEVKDDIYKKLYRMEIEKRITEYMAELKENCYMKKVY